MSLSHSPKISTDGLVFYYDQNNIQKSWRGAPATNLFTETNLNNWSKTAAVSTSPFITPFDTPSYAITDNNTSSYLNIDRNITVANDTSSYTISLFVRKTYGATSARLGFNVGFNGGTLVATNPRFNSDTGVGTGASIDYGDWWYWYFTITNNGTGNTNLYCQFYPATGIHDGSDNPIGVGIATVGAFMLTAGSTAVRFASGTRSNTQAILDLTRRNTVTATSLTYASNDSFSFNGANSVVTTSANAATLGITNDLTLSIFTRRTASPTNSLQGQAGFGSGGSISIKNSGNYFADVITANSTRYVINITTLGSMTSYENVWVNLCTTVSGNTAKTYFNGVLINTQAMDTVIKSLSAETFGIGAGYGYFNMQGDLSNASVYNRALTDGEVQQNFNALRGRYGI